MQRWRSTLRRRHQNFAVAGVSTFIGCLVVLHKLSLVGWFKILITQRKLDSFGRQILPQLTEDVNGVGLDSFVPILPIFDALDAQREHANKVAFEVYDVLLFDVGTFSVGIECLLTKRVSRDGFEERQQILFGSADEPLIAGLVAVSQELTHTVGTRSALSLVCTLCSLPASRALRTVTADLMASLSL